MATREEEWSKTLKEVDENSRKTLEETQKKFQVEKEQLLKGKDEKSRSDSEEVERKWNERILRMVNFQLEISC